MINIYLRMQISYVCSKVVLIDFIILGLALHTFHGNFFVRSTDLLSLPNVNPDMSYAFNMVIEESMKDIATACVQAALLYTSSQGM